MGYLQELDALGRWVFQVAGLRSHRLSHAPPKVARPVILWEMPNSVSGQVFGSYLHTKRRSQFAKLYVNNLDQLAHFVDLLEKNLDDAYNYLPVFENDQAGAAQVGRLWNVRLEIGTTDTLDVPITIRYEALYSRPVPVDPGKASSVTNTIKVKGG